jgi:predicted metal-binding membrane protein
MWWQRSVHVAGAGLVGIAGIAWVGVVLQGMGMHGGATGADALSLSGAAVFIAAWGVMMAAMMLPSATPMIVMYEKVRRGLSQGDHHVVPTALFAAVYLAIWLSLGPIVYVGGFALSAVADDSPIVSAWIPYAVAAIFVATGVYQFTALKQSCLRYCRTPLSFLMARWQSSYAGTLKLAAAHAAYCVGCCAALMVVLVAGGAMSLPWVLLIAAIVFLEKVLPRGDLIARIVGAAFVVLGLAVAVDPDLAAVLRGTSMS